MSHFTTVTLLIFDLEELKICLRELGYTVIPDTTIRGYGNSNQTVDLAVSTSGYPMGFRKNFTGEYEVIADWWGVKGTNEKEFTTKLKTIYAERKVIKFANKNKYIVNKNTSNEGTRIELVRRIY
jgi:hypothetical protein